MSNIQSITTWLRNNTNLFWTRAGGDEPAVKLDRLYINRSEAYEIRDFILRYYKECNLDHKPKNYAITLEKINSYKAGEKVKTQEMLEHFANKLKTS